MFFFLMPTENLQDFIGETKGPWVGLHIFKTISHGCSLINVVRNKLKDFDKAEIALCWDSITSYTTLNQWTLIGMQKIAF